MADSSNPPPNFELTPLSALIRQSFSDLRIMKKLQLHGSEQVKVVEKSKITLPPSLPFTLTS